MKKYYLILLCFLALFLYSCTSEKIVINIEKTNEEYQLITQENEIDLKQYIECNKTYSVIFKEQTYSSKKDLIFILDNGNNIFSVQTKKTNIEIKVFKEYNCTINIIDVDCEILETIELTVNSTLNNQITDFEKYIEEGYEWDGTVFVSKDLETFEKKNINEIKLEENIYIQLAINPKEYTITFNNEGSIETVKIKTGEVINIDNYLKEKEGYKFIGWYLNEQLFESQIYHLNTDITLEAKYEPKSFIIFYTDNMSTQRQTVTYLDEFELITPEKIGYKFLYWVYNDEPFEAGTWTYLTNIYLKAVWEKKEVKLNLETFGGTYTEEIDFDKNGDILLPKPKLENYVFKYWSTDASFKDQVTKVNIETYNNEKLYAYYEYDSLNLKDQIIVTRFNSHASEYDEIAMFDSNQSGFTSKYWHKIGVTKNGEDYYVTSIAPNGTSISELGTYDFVILAYSGYSGYNDFVNMDCNIGYKVKFLLDPTKQETGECVNIVSFMEKEITEVASHVIDHLKEKYDSYETVSSNINLITSYDNYYITWKTSNREIITSKGIYHKPYMSRNVTLSAYIDDIKIYEFSVYVKGETDTSTALSTGYIYTPYNTITQNAMDTLDIIYCAFLEIDGDANWTNLSRIKSNINTYIRIKADKAGTKIVVSVNQSGSGMFSTVSASSSLREKLATNIVDVIKTLDLDGVDIDWETPNSSEAKNFTLLMEAIYKKVKAANPEYLVTAAIGGGKWQPPKYDLPNSIKYLDYVNLMTYSMTSGNGYYQNSLYASTKNRTLVSCSIDESIDIYNNLNVPNNKILVGIPFYVTVQSNCGGPGSGSGTGKAVWYSKMYDTYALSGTMKEYFDDECGVPYRYDATNKIFISFDNDESIKVKCEYINTLGLAGIMYWQYGQDVNDTLSDSIDKYINN